MIFFHITDNCNFDCIHCYLDKKCNRKRNHKLFDIVDHVIKIKPQNVIITGGEPLVLNNIDGFFKLFYDSEISLTLITNGYYLNEYVTLLKSKYFDIAWISLYGPTKIEYENICRVNNSWDKVISNIQLAINNEIPIGVNCILSNGLLNDWIEIINYLLNLGVRNYRFIWGAPENISNASISYSCNPKEWKNRINSIIEFKAKLPKDINFYNENTFVDNKTSLKTIKSQQCTINKNRITVDFNGNLFPCCTLVTSNHYKPLFNILSVSNESQWKEIAEKLGNDYYPCYKKYSSIDKNYIAICPFYQERY